MLLFILHIGVSPTSCWCWGNLDTHNTFPGGCT